MNKHAGLIHFLMENKNDIWVAPIIEIAGLIKKYQQTRLLNLQENE
jgi:hypothetical protein